MKEKALEVLNIFNEHGFEAYIVGGYVRDLLLGKNSLDIDICTNATPKDIISIFDIEDSNTQYGSVRVIYKKCIFDVTTYRKEIKYEGNRNPIKIKYINNLKKDLLRRDFTINTLCMDKNGDILDLLGVKQDLDNKLIKTVGNPKYKIKEDSLRILRAIRFSSVLGFDISSKTKYAIKRYGYLLKKLSYSRKKEELDKIFSSLNKEKGRELILELGLDKSLELNKLKDIVLCDYIIGTWAQLEVLDKYPFTKLERFQINKINELLSSDITDKYVLYKNGLYLCSIVAQIKNIDIKKITKIYNELSIYSLQEINIKPIEIANILNKKPGSFIKDILKDIEKQIVYGKLDNDEKLIKEYILNKY